MIERPETEQLEDEQDERAEFRLRHGPNYVGAIFQWSSQDGL